MLKLQTVLNVVSVIGEATTVLFSLRTAPHGLISADVSGVLIMANNDRSCSMALNESKTDSVR